jgi:hypothetical protein
LLASSLLTSLERELILLNSSIAECFTPFSGIEFGMNPDICALDLNLYALYEVLEENQPIETKHSWICRDQEHLDRIKWMNAIILILHRKPS